MKPKKKVTKVGKKVNKNVKNMDEEIKENENVAPNDVTDFETPKEVAPEVKEEVGGTDQVKIASFSGDFGREDLNSLRDKLNEVIDCLNK